MGLALPPGRAACGLCSSLPGPRSEHRPWLLADASGLNANGPADQAPQPSAPSPSPITADPCVFDSGSARNHSQRMRGPPSGQEPRPRLVSFVQSLVTYI